jgi:anti-sigma B factor antagonist
MTMTTQYYQLQNRDAYCLLSFAGDLDAHSVEVMRPALHSQIGAECAMIVIDLSRVSFIDSHGVGLFVSLLKRAHANKGKLYIAGADGQPAAVLRMVGLGGDLVTYCLSKEDALADIALAAPR